MKKNTWAKAKSDPKLKGYAGGGEADDDQEEEAPVYDATPSREIASDDPPAEAADAAPTVPRTSKDNVVNVREQLEDFLSRQKNGSDAMHQLSDQYGQELEKAGNRRDNSGFNALADHYYGTNFAKTYADKKPPSAVEQLEKKMGAQEAVNKSDDPVAQELLKEYGADNNAVGKEQANYIRGLASANHQDVAHNHQLDKMEDDMGKSMNPLTSVYGSGNNNLGIRLARARSINALIAQHPNYDFDPREQKDLAVGLASLITNQNRVPYELAQSLVPKTWKGDVASFAEYVMNHPESTDSKDFIQRMAQTVAREQDVTAKQIDAIQQQQGVRFARLAAARPQSHAAQMKAGKLYTQMPALDNTAAIGADVAPPKGSVPVKNSRTGAMGWKTPDGKIIPRRQ